LDALRRLRGEGLIDIDVHKNTRVTPLNATEARELFEIRMALDPAAAELAAQRAPTPTSRPCAAPPNTSSR
jgi:DNA-binding GntR family transcriptional regulator